MVPKKCLSMLSKVIYFTFVAFYFVLIDNRPAFISDPSSLIVSMFLFVRLAG